MYGDPTTTPGGKALKFYCSVRCQIAKVGGSNINEKIGGEDITVGHTIRATVKKNKVAPPFRKAEFIIYYDGREVDKVDELAQVVLIKGLIPKYDAAGNISETGRTYKMNYVNKETGEIEEELVAKKKDDVADALRKCPKIQDYLINILKNGIDTTEVYNSKETDAELTEEEFEKQMEEDLKKIENGIEDDGAEETSWDDM
jgi:recombination protein RecA